MRKLLPILAAALAAGCAHYELNATSNTAGSAAAVPGRTVTGGSVQVQAGGSSAAAALIAIGILAGVAAREPAASPAPVLAPERRVNEQDCTQPIADPGANLKCR